jgi:deazaflavin-dependent oxidoreductase (nitroreductase family)
MPAPRWLARTNRHLANRVLGPLASRLPGFGVIVHTGRKSGRQYRTPVNVFRRDDSYVIALTYGPVSDWVRNVLAHGGCALETRGRTVQLIHPRLVRDEGRRAMPALVRPILGLVHVSDFLQLDLQEAASGSQSATPVPAH